MESRLSMRSPAVPAGAGVTSLLRPARAAFAMLRELVMDLQLRLRDRRFWAVQAMVVAVTAAHSTLETFEQIGGHELGAVYFVPASLYFVPVVYASLNFGRRGAIPTAVWSAMLAMPNIFLWHGEGAEWLGELFQMCVLVGLAIVIATRVDAERAARRLAEGREAAREASELKYRQIFAAVGEPVLVFDLAGVIRESNAAAAAFLGHPRTGLRGMSLSQVLGPQGAAHLQQIAAGTRDEVDLAVKRPDGGETWVEPVCTPLASEEQGLLMQVLFRDVTDRRNVESFAQEVARAQEEERQHIAHELHDVALQWVVALCRRMDAAAEKIPEHERQPLLDARDSAEELADQLRRFARDLRPPVLDSLGLTPAVRRLVTELSVRTGQDARFQLIGEPRQLDPSADISLFRICQEALRNAERHAGPSRVSVRLTYRPDCVRMSIADDGCGFEVPSFAALTGRGSFGLLGIRERARLLGGKCRITSGPGKGTRVEVSVPGESNGARQTAPARKERRHGS